MEKICSCQCYNNKEEKETEINTIETEAHKNSEPEILNTFNPDEYENLILNEKNEKKGEITDLDSNIYEDEKEQYDAFSTRALGIINQIRKDPKSYSKTILDNMQYITVENGKNIFKKKVKVLLNKGEEAFTNAAKELSQLNPMNELIMKPEIIIPLPESEDQINNNFLFRNKANIIRKTYNINIYFKNEIKNPEIAVLLMIVDDTENSPGKKRNAILNPQFRKIGIKSKFISNKFISYFSFSK